MIKLIDRQMIRGYVKAYLVCLTSLLSLYVVVDLFTNLDDFTHRGHGFFDSLKHIFAYYSVKVTQIFDRLCEAIVLLAAVFTVALMQRNNEQVPLLSAGVSTRRIVAPVLICACLMLTLAALNQELLIPHLGDRLLYDKDDPGGDKNVTQLHGQYDWNGMVHVFGKEASRKGNVVSDLQLWISEKVAGSEIHLTAEKAYYVPLPPGQHSPARGKWELTDVNHPELKTWDPNILEQVDKGHYILYVRSADFDSLTRNPNWYLLASTWRLHEELERPESGHQTAMAVLFHMRLTRPILGILLVFLGMSVILRDQNRNVIISSGMCLVVCGVFFGLNYACKMLGDNDYLSPALAAWMPVLISGPFALVMFDAVHT
jgi:lipopolysaccharide export system permease protein